MALSITDLATEARVASGTLRFYERAGLISPSGRTPAGYRLFEETAAGRVKFIKDAQRTGLRLREIKELLQVMDQGACSCGHTVDLVARRIGEVDAEVARLASLRAELVAMLERNEECLATWPCNDLAVKPSA
jgi:DNA-binding transcriptional MerR regulator